MNGNPSGESSGEMLRSGDSRATYKWTVRNTNLLRVGSIIESDLFEIGGYYWILVAMLVSRLNGGLTFFKTMCVSLNSESVHADVQLKAGNGTSSSRNDIRRIPCTACPSGWIYKADIFLRPNLCTSHRGASLAANNLVVEIDFKHVRKARRNDPKGRGSDIARKMFLEVTDPTSIERYCNGNMYGVAPQRPIPNLEVHRDSLARYWGQQSLDHRYWWYQRNDWDLKVKKCLSDFGPFTTLSKMHVNGQVPGVFKGERPVGGEFKDTYLNAEFFFVKLIESDFQDPSSYYGYFLARKTDSVECMLHMMSDDLRYRDGHHPKAYVEVGRSLREMTEIQSSVGDCRSLRESSVIALRSLP